MANGWTSERRARQSMLIRHWQPWNKSTGPRTDEGKVKSARNADKGGHWRLVRDITNEVNQLLREQRKDLQVLRSQEMKAAAK